MPKPSRRRERSPRTGPRAASRTWGILLLVGLAVAAILLAKGLLSPAQGTPPPEAAEPGEAVAGPADPPTEQPAPLAINPADPPEAQFDQALANSYVTFVLFHSTTCIPCKQMERVTAEVRPEFEGRVAFVDVKVNDRANMALIQRMAIRVIPTTLVFDRTGAHQVFYGAMSPDALRAELEAALAR